jgi:hypothetical protein
MDAFRRHENIEKRSLLRSVQRFYVRRITAIKLVAAIILFTVFIGIMLLILIQLSIPRELPTPTMAIINCNIWTADSKNPHAESIAVQDGKIIFVGKTETFHKQFLISNTTQLIDCSKNEKYKLITPGFIDSHAHILSGATLVSGVNLRDVKSKEEFRTRLGDYVRERWLLQNEWVLGGRWNQMTWNGTEPDKSWIDDIVPNNPAYLRREDGHMSLVNQVALDRAKITSKTIVQGGTIDLGPDGQPNGLLRDNAQDLIEGIIPPFANVKQDQIFKQAFDLLLSNGVTYVQDMSGTVEYTIYRRLANENKLPIRVRSAFRLHEWQLLVNEMKKYNDDSSKYLWIGVLKGFSDGSTGSHTAYHFDPYVDEQTNYGLLLTSPEELLRDATDADKAGLQVAIHACGDHANRILLDLFKNVTLTNPDRDRRFRIEHAESVRVQDLQDFKNIIVSMQPMHLLDDIQWAENMLGPQRIYDMYRFGSLRNHSAGLVLGSDWPVATPNTIEGIYAAVTRNSVNYPNGFAIEERLTMEQTLRAYTVDAAYASFMEKKVGMIKQGLLADIVILDQDLFNIEWKDIKNTKVELTVVDGKIAYTRNNTVNN